MKALRWGLQFIFLFFIQQAYAQQNGTLFLSAETLNKNAYSYETEQPYYELAHPELLSNKDWKYHPGDDLRWKEPTFDDQNWSLFHTDFNLDSISKDKWQGIGWFRLKILIDSSLYNQPLALVLTHFGASEIYFDGKLMNQFGIPSKEPKKEKTFRPLYLQPVILPLDNKTDHLLAVRYSLMNANKLFDKYRNGFLFKYNQPGYAGFTVYFGNAKETIALYGNSLKNNLLYAIITFTALFLMATFHASLYLFYSRYRSNLYLAIFNFTVAGFLLTEWLPTYAHLSLQSAMLNGLLVDIFWTFWIPVSMLAYYSVFYKKLPRHVWLYFSAPFLMVCNWFYPLSFLWTFHICLLYIAFIDMMRLFIKSLIKKEKNVWIIGIGVLLSQSAWILYQNYFNPWVGQHQEFLAYCIALAVPITLLIFNALRTARTTINLEKQLVEVKRLSDLSISQEQEKQQILTAQKEKLEQQVQERTEELSQSLENLKSTQDQLIQSEKMASMGELTAGIAHEIQNPLNFVNNFSELNSELSEEIITALKFGNIKEAETLAEDIRSNQMKVREHGQQAEAIVKSMLQHSHSGAGHKEPTDINALANEYLRLAFNGFRAKNKAFSATLKLDLDTSLEKFQVIPEQIGRVLLNLYNNAFYTVSEKKKTAGEDYIPTVTVSTGRINNMIKISVKDNGMGMSDNVSHKIFQPFFTTKPAGKGAGLGLSLSYDIIKAHHGEIKADSQEGEFTEITVLLPAL